MNPAETAVILRQFNEWRRGDEDIPQPDPREIGEAIDAAVEMIDRLEATEKDSAHHKALAESALRVAKGWEDKCDELRAKIEEMEKQEPVATIHINSITGNPSVYFIPGHRYLHHNSSLYALPGAQPAPNFADAYQDAMEEAAIWKKRALEAEDLNRKFVAEINGPTYMGEPAQPAPSGPDLLESLRCACNYIDKLGGVSQQYRAVLASPEAKP